MISKDWEKLLIRGEKDYLFFKKLFSDEEFAKANIPMLEYALDSFWKDFTTRYKKLLVKYGEERRVEE